MKIKDIRLALMKWAQLNGILYENVPFEDGGDIRLVPFEDKHVDYFRTRKIVRIEEDQNKITIYSRLPIAKLKKATLIKDFNSRYSNVGISLLIDASTPYKIDQNLSTYGKFEPSKLHNGKICCGSSIGIGNQRNAGTLTALARNKNGLMFGISCNHVIGGCNITQPGLPIVSPGIQDITVENHSITVIGYYEQSATMAQGLPSVINTNINKDLACFTILNEELVSSYQGSGTDKYDTPTSFINGEKGMLVKKWGRSTGLTKGEITFVGKGKRPEQIEYNIVCFYSPTVSQIFKGTIYYNEIFRVTPIGGRYFSLGGDSGALVVTDNTNEKEKTVGVIIGGGKQQSIMLPIEPALNELKLDLVDKHNI